LGEYYNLIRAKNIIQDHKSVITMLFIPTAEEKMSDFIMQGR